MGIHQVSEEEQEPREAAGKRKRPWRAIFQLLIYLGKFWSEWQDLNFPLPP